MILFLFHQSQIHFKVCNRSLLVSPIKHKILISEESPYFLLASAKFHVKQMLCLEDTSKKSNKLPSLYSEWEKTF